MTAMAARFLVVAAVSVLVAGGLVAAPKRAGATVSTADAVIVEVCRFLPFLANPAVPGAFSTVFAVRVTNAGGTVSEGPVVAGLSQLVRPRQKSDLQPVTTGPLQPVQVARFKWKDAMLFPGVEMKMIAAFDGQANPGDVWENNLMFFADPWAVPAC